MNHPIFGYWGTLFADKPILYEICLALRLLDETQLGIPGICCKISMWSKQKKQKLYVFKYNYGTSGTGSHDFNH